MESGQLANVRNGASMVVAGDRSIVLQGDYKELRNGNIYHIYAQKVENNYFYYTSPNPQIQDGARFQNKKDYYARPAFQQSLNPTSHHSNVPKPVSPTGKRDESNNKFRLKELTSEPILDEYVIKQVQQKKELAPTELTHQLEEMEKSTFKPTTEELTCKLEEIKDPIIEALQKKESTPKEFTHKDTGFAFDSPGYESFFASQLGVCASQNAWNVARPASAKSRPKNQKKYFVLG